MSEIKGIRNIQENVKSLRDIALETIREAIVTGYFKPKQHLRERELAKEMGISTTPIKEAFRILSHEGLVETIPRKGTYVSELVNSSIEEILMLKANLEGMCARLAAQKASEEELHALDLQLEKMEQLKQSHDIERYRMANEAFHMTIRTAAKSPLLYQTVMNVINFDKAFRKRALQLESEIEQGFIEHRGILEAIKQRDGELAEERMKYHITRTAQHVLHEETPVKPD